jgi:hypothetical protein
VRILIAKNPDGAMFRKETARAKKMFQNSVRVPARGKLKIEIQRTHF